MAATITFNDGNSITFTDSECRDIAKDITDYLHTKTHGPISFQFMALSIKRDVDIYLREKIAELALESGLEAGEQIKLYREEVEKNNFLKSICDQVTCCISIVGFK